MQFDGHIKYSNRAVLEFNIIKYLMGDEEMFKFYFSINTSSKVHHASQ